MKDFLRNIAEKDLYYIAEDMGVREESIDRFMKKRFMTLMVFLFLSIPAAIFKVPVGIGVIVVGVFIYRNAYTSYKKQYEGFLFQREFEFNSLMKMMIPYLKQGADQGEEGNSFYTVLGKCHRRLDKGIIKDNLERLMVDMVDQPNSILPFRRFAADSSGSDDADLIMLTIYEYQANSSDISIIDELGHLITERMMRSIDVIIKGKVSRFGTFPTVVTMYPLMIIFAYTIGVAIYEMAGFGGG